MLDQNTAACPVAAQMDMPQKLAALAVIVPSPAFYGHFRVHSLFPLFSFGSFCSTFLKVTLAAAAPYTDENARWNVNFERLHVPPLAVLPGAC